MDGERHTVAGSDGVSIGLLTAGSGPPLLLVHGGVGQIERWEPVWDQLSARWQVTAMDRRGRGSSDDGPGYSIEAEYGDVAAVAAALSTGAGRPIDVFGHSFGATCTIGAARRSAPFRRVVLYEPPAGETVTPEFVDRLGALVDQGRAGKAMVIFLMEVIGLDSDEVDAPARHASRLRHPGRSGGDTAPRGTGPARSRPPRTGRGMDVAGALPRRGGQPGLGPHHHPEDR